MQNSIKQIEYQIYTQNLPGNFIKVTISFEAGESNPILKIPSWRPGRYMLQQYAANVRDCSAQDQSGALLSVEKVNRNSWQVEAPAGTVLSFTYLYYCRQMDAGGCWSDQALFYINPIACLMAVDKQEQLPCSLKLNLSGSFIVKTGMPQKAAFHYQTDGFLALSDFPILASPDLTTLEYQVNGIPFYIHATVDASHFPETITEDFATFTEAQIRDFGDFPEKEYHFQLLILPYQHYHGVEHRNSTVICLGPAADVKEKLYPELIGICSHELYHTWNICKIRPAEMLPYNLFEAQYFKTGFVAEGITTYLGDYYVAHADVFTKDWYQEELNILLKRHFYSFGNKHLSLADSSLDLWVDGYDAGIPNRKVSIYVKGAIVAFLMDAAIRKTTSNDLTLRDMMLTLWNSHKAEGKGYTEDSIAALFHSMTSNQYAEDFMRWIYGLGDLKEDLIKALNYLGISVTEESHANFFARHFGFLCDAAFTIQTVDDASPYLTLLGKGDRILRINGVIPVEFKPEEVSEVRSFTIECTNGIQIWSVELKHTEAVYFKTLQIQFTEETTLF
ncbi:MAG: M61 family metallopeptidase [Cytophaga sp.]|uniref:M61 family metallopeptidase n=1 Tax=Cytophaga sp. TaxID=29535 RepID=UPI003F811753